MCSFAVTLYWILLIQLGLEEGLKNEGGMQVPTGSLKAISLVFVMLLFSALVLSGCNKGTPAVTTTQTAPRATANVNINPSSVMPGQSATLSWSSSNASTCTASGTWSGTLGMSGSITVVLQGAAAQSYTLTCSGVGLPSESTATLAVSQEQGACAVHGAVRAHSGKRTATRRKLTGTRS
jgi:hypothetical protein